MKLLLVLAFGVQCLSFSSAENSATDNVRDKANPIYGSSATTEKECVEASRDIKYSEQQNGMDDAFVEVQYTAAVLEYDPYNDLSEGGLPLLQENAKIYLEYAAQAQQEGADIIVFPEYGLTSTHFGSTFDLFLSQTQVVPDAEEEAIPCYYTQVDNYTKIIQDLSCGALELEMYLVVNLAEQVECQNDPSLDDVRTSHVKDTGTSNDESSQDCPDSGYLIYNTNVAFDSSGKVIAKYRKKHLFLEPYFTVGDQPDVAAVFSTSFGVTFTMQICFDIMYESPALKNMQAIGIQDAILSTCWIDELPFLTAPQMWKGWSEGNKVNLLAANYHAPSKGELGSGIFRGFTSEPETYYYSASGGTKLLVGKVVTNSSSSNYTMGHNDVPTYGQKDRPIINDYDEYLEQHTTPILTLELSESEMGNLQEPKELSMGKNQSFYHEDLRLYNSSILEKSDNDIFIKDSCILEKSDNDILFIKDLCHSDGLCCTLAYTYKRNETEEGVFMLLAYSGVVGKGGGVYEMYIQTCAVVFCLNDDINSCAKIEGEDVRDSTLRVFELSGTYVNPYVYPSVLTQNLELQDPTNCVFSLDEKSDYFFAAINCDEKIENLLSLTLFSRWYSNDP